MARPIIEKYATWAAFVEAAKEAQAARPTATWAKRETEKVAWRGTATWAEAIDLATDGWDTVRPEIERLAEHIKEEVRPLLVDTFRSDFDVAGAAVDISRFLEGEPECMVQLTPIKVAKPGRVISILVNTGVRSSVQPETVRKRGAAVCALVEVLELLQHSTEVWIESTGIDSGEPATSGKGPVTVLVKVKSAEDQLDIGLLSFALAHPSTHRRLVFARREACGFARDGQQGRSVELTQQAEVQADVVLDTVLKREVENPAAWIRQHLVDFALLAPEPTA